MKLLDSDFVWYLKTGFKLKDSDIGNPFALSSTEIVDEKNILVLNEQSRRILELYTNNIQYEAYETKREEIWIGDGYKYLSYIDSKYLFSLCKENKFKVEKVDETTIFNIIRELSVQKVITDMQSQILMKIVEKFDIYTGGILVKKEVDKSIYEIAGDKYIQIYMTLTLPFRDYIERIRQYDYQDVYDALMAFLSKKYYNEKLPTPQVPLFLFPNMTDVEGNELKPEYWQIYVLYNRKRYNFVFSSRQSGKTFLSAGAIALMETFLNKTNNVLYVCKNEKVFTQPRAYLTMFSKKGSEMKVFDAKDSTNTITNNITGNKIWMVGAGSEMGVRSFSPDIVIFDEANYIKNSVWLDVLPILEKKNCDFYGFSTINWESKDQVCDWAYEEFLAGEMGLDEDYFSLRVTIDDVTHIKEKNKERLKRGLKKYPNRYFCELYSILPGTGDMFDDLSFFSLIKDLYIPYHKYIIGVDLAKKQDTTGITVLDIERGIFVEERILMNMAYIDQREIIENLKAKYNKAIVAIDATGVGEAVSEILGDIIDFKFRYTSGTKMNKNLKHGVREYHVPKKSLVYNFIDMIEKQEIKSSATLEKLRNEMNNFGISKTSNGGTKYEASIGATDDVLNSAFIASYIYKYTVLVYNDILYGLQKDPYFDAEAISISRYKKQTHERYKKHLY